MNKYAILANPGHNRVYFESSKQLAIQELSIVLSNSLQDSCNYNIADIKEEYLSDIFYITFLSDKKLCEDVISDISRLSFLYAFFEVIENEGKFYLSPIAKANNEYINPSISSILKYTGKTNEIFTRMMINVALYSSKYINEEINILDPIAGKGTTLYEGLIYGHNSYGIEISDKVALESYQFMKKYLEKEKLKHGSKKATIGVNGSKSTKYSIEISKNKEDLKENKTTNFAIVAGDSKNADKFYKKDFFHLIVGDLPYGVQHGNITKEKQTNITRNPKELISNCVGSWRNVLKKDGVMVLAWNSFILSREDFTELIEKNGFQVLASDLYLKFEHRVDQAIRRDIIVAKKLI